MHPQARYIPLINAEGAYRITGACPGEYCSYGAWTLNATVTLLGRPAIDADSVGSVPVGVEFCADSGFVLLDPPGRLVTLTPPPPNDAYSPPFGQGDTLLILDEQGEGYWSVRWRDTIFETEAYWYYDSTTVHVLQKQQSFWWAHVTDRHSGAEGWLRMDTGAFHMMMRKSIPVGHRNAASAELCDTVDSSIKDSAP